MLGLGLIFWPLTVFDRVKLGKHALNQVLMGSLFGIWCACFNHFVLRDFVYNHVNWIHTKGASELTSK